MSKGVLIAVGAVAAGAAVLFMGGGTAHAAAQSNALPPGSPNPPPDVINEIGQAMSTVDPTTIRRTADDVEKKGFPIQAADMRSAATAIENAAAIAKNTTPVPGLTAPLPSLPVVPPIAIPPGIIPPGIVPPFTTPPAVPPSLNLPSPSAGVTPLSLANQVNLNIASSTRGSENKDLVAAFQVQEKSRGHYAGTIDGLWGPNIALALAQDFGIIPSKPMYFAKNPTPGKQAYTKALLAIAATDPQRATQWVAASDVKNI